MLSDVDFHFPILPFFMCFQLWSTTFCLFRHKIHPQLHVRLDRFNCISIWRILKLKVIAKTYAKNKILTWWCHSHFFSVLVLSASQYIFVQNLCWILKSQTSLCGYHNICLELLSASNIHFVSKHKVCWNILVDISINRIYSIKCPIWANQFICHVDSSHVTIWTNQHSQSKAISHPFTPKIQNLHVFQLFWDD